MTIRKWWAALWAVLRCSDDDLDELLVMFDQLREFRALVKSDEPAPETQTFTATLGETVTRPEFPIIEDNTMPPPVKHTVRLVNKGWGKPTRVRDEDIP